MELSHKTGKDFRKKKWSKKKKLDSRFNNKKLMKPFTTYKNKSFQSSKNCIDQFEFFTNVSEWSNKSMEEMGTLARDVQQRAQEGMDTMCIIKPETKRTFWKSKKMNNESFSRDEMWTFSSKKLPLLSLTSSSNSSDGLDQQRIFWKTSKMSLPQSFSEQKNKQNQNMLWRSLKHLQRLYEENCADIDKISEIFNEELQKISNHNSIDIVGHCLLSKNFANETMLRKARLSRWTFLRHDNTYRQVSADLTKSKSYQNSRFLMRLKANGKSGENQSLVWKNISDNTRHWDDANDDVSSETCESCNCSCCSCEKCSNDLKENPSLSIREKLSEVKMAPNSEEDIQIAFQNKRTWGMEFTEKEPLRPPVYNPEDYATSLKKWGKKSNNGIQMPLYLSQSTGTIDRISAEISLQPKKQSSPSTKSSSSTKSGDEKQLKKEKELTLKVEKKDLKNKENINRGLKNELLKDFRNPILTLSTQEGEMTLRQFSSVTELLAKLKVDLKLSFPSFVQEFVGDPLDGVTLLLELLRAVQLSQATQQRCPPQVLRRALLDEHSCLVCLKHCLRCSDATRRLASSPAGLFTLAVCIMNNVTQTRIIALELLTKTCEPPAKGHKAVSEALSTLRLRFGEPVRFRFLVGMLNSAGAVELLATAMKFINVFVETAPSIQQKVYIQAELEQAGFDSKILRRTLPCNSESVKVELNKWERSYFDVEALQNKVEEVNVLQEKIQILEKRIQILQEEKGILQSLEQCLKERCSELEEEVSIKTNPTTKSSQHTSFLVYNSQQNKKNNEKGESTPAEDEGISSSEQELSQDEDYIKGTISYNNSNDFEKINNSNESRMALNTESKPKKLINKPLENKLVNCNYKNIKNIKSNKMIETNVDDGNEIVGIESNEEEETTIDEVIEELENIVNHAEAYESGEKTKSTDSKVKSANAFKSQLEINLEEKCKTYSKSTMEKDGFEESEIIPSILHPQPPRKAKSLVHIYFPGRDFDSHENVKSEFFDEDTDSESSDSLLTAAREKKALHKSCRRSLEVSDSFNSFSSMNTRTLYIKQEEEEYDDSELNMKLDYEERNIDEEEIKRKHLKNNPQGKVEKNPNDGYSFQLNNSNKKFMDETKAPSRIIRGSGERLNENNLGNFYEKTTSFRGIKSCITDKVLNESPFTKTQKFVPTPVKRSQTFHTTTSDGEKLHRRVEVKPKPKMGVSGLDFQRSVEQKAKNDSNKYQSAEYKKNSDKRTDANDRYSKRISKDIQKNQVNDNDGNVGLLRRGSFDGLISTKEAKVDRTDKTKKIENAISRHYSESSVNQDKSSSKFRSKSLEKMDEGLDSLVDIVIAPEETKKQKTKNEWHVEVSKNIGPRTRRSLAESSLFIPQFTKNAVKPESPKPPKPAQRTSLTRNNSSSTPLHLPIEIKLAPVRPKEQPQVVYNFGMKQAKSEDSLLTSTTTPIRRCPPDGASSPMVLRKTSYENQKSSEEKPPIYSTPVKQYKLQKFFGNPNFENSTGKSSNTTQKYFENNYACTGVNREKSVNPMPRNIQNVTGSAAQKMKANSAQQNSSSQKLPEKKDSPSQSKPNFLLGTYQSQSTKLIPPKPIGNSSVLNSINHFNNSFLAKRANTSCTVHSEKRKNNSNLQTNEKSEKFNSRQLNTGSAVGSEKVTDFPSGLY